MQFILEEDTDSSYAPRTEVNAKEADITFAIAIKFDSAGEKLTKSMALKHSKLYIPVSPSGDIKSKADKIVDLINKTFDASKTTIILNIAGNGIYTMKGVMTQEQCDDFTYELLHSIIKHPRLWAKVKSIRSGGQTGFDEAGIKAGLRLGLDTTAYYPKGFRIRDMVSDKTQTREDIFKTFKINYQGQLKEKVKMFVDMDNVLCDFVKSYLEWKQEHPEITYPQSQFGFFSNLYPVEGAVEAFKKLDKEFDVYILTKPSVYNLMCFTEKADWVKRHLGFQFVEKLIIMCDKSMVKAKGAYLIDDDIQAGQLQFEGEFIRFKTEKFPNWEVTLKYLGL